MSMTAEDVAKQIEDAKERGRWEGSITAKLEMLLAQGVATSSGMADVRSQVQVLSNQFTDLRAGMNAHRDDLAETKEWVKRIDTEYVKKSDLEEILRPLKAVADRLNNWAWSVALAGLSSSALTIVIGIGYLKFSGTLP